MNLAQFTGQDEIFVDANIFTYFALDTAGYQDARYLLLPTDALHVATCQQHGIRHCATADAHFERVDSLPVWRPDRR